MELENDKLIQEAYMEGHLTEYKDYYEVRKNDLWWIINKAKALQKAKIIQILEVEHSGACMLCNAHKEAIQRIKDETLY